MFLSVVIALLVAVAAANPLIKNYSQPQVLTYEMNTANMPNSYNFYYDTSDGSSRREEGTILDPGTENEALDVLGTVRWYDAKGSLYQMTYKAGKRGYRTSIKKLS